ncbi:hypothetical protein EIN_056800 [Entamoeba invadens IP1]|uniref:hypothetical protein n=1 Tax=Entamoeba invadens IP1 TaxID=370355 RepID=UPI0002C3F566|nr:hypothetical protein EIN_056800 [Entamoeba invadens IP1]ELP93295.1 hypothetical protein EIN_056800 [Entamoeba invadens IP1]|eukprot:XP_004260066.1 hypothetical protein EIN_056800 [Entamoeba invadens IP1]
MTEFTVVTDKLKKHKITIFNQKDDTKVDTITEAKWLVFKLEYFRREILKELIIHAHKYKLPTVFFNGVMVANEPEECCTAFLSFALSMGSSLFDPNGDVYPHFQSESILSSIPPKDALECIFNWTVADRSTVSMVLSTCRTYLTDKTLFQVFDHKLSLCYSFSPTLQNDAFQRFYVVVKKFLDFYSSLVDVELAQDFETLLISCKESMVKIGKAPCLDVSPPEEYSPRTLMSILSPRKSRSKIVPYEPTESSQFVRTMQSPRANKTVYVSDLEMRENKKRSLSINEEDVLKRKSGTSYSLPRKSPTSNFVTPSVSPSPLSLQQTTFENISMYEKYQSPTLLGECGIGKYLEQCDKDLLDVDFVFSKKMMRTKKSGNFTDIRSRIIAEQLYVYDLKMLGNTSIGDIINGTQNAKEYISSLNCIELLVQCFISKENNSDTFDFFIRVGYKCLIYGDYNASFLVYSAISSQTQKYQKAWQEIKEVDKFKTLEAVFCVTNTKAYTNHFDKCKTMKFPIVSSVLRVIEQTKALPEPENTENAKNEQYVFKMKRMYKSLKPLETLYKTFIPYESIEGIQEYISLFRTE